MKSKVIVLILIFAFLICTVASAQNDEKNTVSYDAKAICVMFAGTQQLAVSQNETERFSIAGLSRLPALILISQAIEKGDLKLDTDITVSHAASQVKGPTAFVEANEIIKAELLFKSAAMICAGDAIHALAEKMCGNSDVFILKINELLSSLGIDITYRSIMGDEVQMNTQEIAKLAYELSKQQCYLKYSSVYMDSITHGNGKTTELVNQNRLIRNMQGCTGLITGSSAEAGYCGAFYTQRNSCSYICVVLGAKNSNTRFKEAQSATEYCFATFKTTSISSKGDIILEKYPLKNAIEKNCTLISMHDAAILTKQDIGKPTCTYDLPQELYAPIKAGDIVGNATYTDSLGNVLCAVELTVSKDIEKARFTDFIKFILCNWLM